MSDPQVCLTWVDITAGARVALRRFTHDYTDGYDHDMAQRDPWRRFMDHLGGGCGEAAAARIRGISWDQSVDRFHSLPDIGADLEIRHSFMDHYGLINRPADNSSLIYELWTGTPPVLTQRGWAPGWDVRKRGRWYDANGRPGMWILPQQLLAPGIP